MRNPEINDLPIDETSVLMPDEAEMDRRLQGANLLGRDDLIDRFFKRFIDQVAGQERYGVGLQLAYELASADITQEYPMVVKIATRVRLDKMFDDVINTVTPDPQVAQEAKNARKKVQEEVERQLR